MISETGQKRAKTLKNRKKEVKKEAEMLVVNNFFVPL